MLCSHQTAVPLVFSDLLTQTLQLQLVDLQVGPDSDIRFNTQGRGGVAGMRLLTVSLCVRPHTLHPAARAAGFWWGAVWWSR